MIRRPSGLNDADTTDSCPYRRGGVTASPVAVSQAREVPSAQAVTTRRPSGLKRAVRTGPRCRRGGVIGRPVTASHTRAVWLLLAVTTLRPSGLNVAWST